MLTIYDWFGYEIPMKQRYRMIRQAGFDGVLLWWSEDFDRGDYRESPALARAAGLFVEDIHTPFDGINNLWLDNIDGEALTDCLLQCVTDCAAFEIPTMIVHLSGGENPPSYNPLGISRISRVVGKAERLGINVALENLRHVAYLDYVLNQINSPRLGFCYDSGHHNCRNPGDDMMGRHGSRLMALHLHDNDGSDDQHLLPFDGTTDWPAIMASIAGTGYTGPTALEVMNGGYERLSPEEFLAAAFERGKRLEGMRKC
ncbi:MAG: sugar phosphate isomerase/epimerase [Oscillospiraceae bacterium]|nr:sugar phosphate isomerase/epimerase [Oscillospiraceae bacterium]